MVVLLPLGVVVALPGLLTDGVVVEVERPELCAAAIPAILVVITKVNINRFIFIHFIVNRKSCGKQLRAMSSGLRASSIVITFRCVDQSS
jgi:hypothetical protein